MGADNNESGLGYRYTARKRRSRSYLGRKSRRRLLLAGAVGVAAVLALLYFS